MPLTAIAIKNARSRDKACELHDERALYASKGALHSPFDTPHCIDERAARLCLKGPWVLEPPDCQIYGICAEWRRPPA